MRWFRLAVRQQQPGPVFYRFWKPGEL